MIMVEFKNNLGQLHRDDGPAVDCNGHKWWYTNGQIHREGGLPAIECTSGTKMWYELGQLHRDGGLPAVEYASGGKEWLVKGFRHRDGGLPAVERVNGYNKWYVNGELHREGGLPAIECINGDVVWFINGEELSFETGLAYMAFCQKMQEKRRVMAQKKLYFWWIQICYDLEHPSGCGQRMAQKNLDVYESMMTM